ncbi:ozone-responsive stress-like protein [Thalictrum thalictroides]|uniref:Ozone-responsive stress-like protein n=1 Tax=Thalictrum thalictroides TaxID=46969 RepID=A0A7J6VL88_THATH|nr:ozone-responsive stress-like protein [Thalictrum thalictroides]
MSPESLFADHIRLEGRNVGASTTIHHNSTGESESNCCCSINIYINSNVQGLASCCSSNQTIILCHSSSSPNPRFEIRFYYQSMSGAKIVGALIASGVVAYICDITISDHKIFGGTTPSTITNKEWQEETDKRLQAWPRTAGSPVVMNPISRQNFIVNSRVEE